MFVRNGVISSESVSEGHPDKLADRISDAILDEFLRLESDARVACETLLADQCVIVAGEFKTCSPQTFRSVRERAVAIVSDVLRDAGYHDSATGIDPDHCEIQIRFNHQSADINQGVDRIDGSLGAGDQGLMFGYACDETPELMPAPIVFAHRLMRRQAELRRSGALPWLRPDAKSQVSFRYEDGRPVAIEAVVVSTQHDASIDQHTLIEAVRREIIAPVIPAELRADNYRELINPQQIAESSVPITADGVITERFMRYSDTEILYQFTVDDDNLYSQPWTAELSYHATEGPMYEYACHEGNYAMPGILAGARRAEAEAAGEL